MSGLRSTIAKGEWQGCSIHYSLRGYIQWQCQKSSPFGPGPLQTVGMFLPGPAQITNLPAQASAEYSRSMSALRNSWVRDWLM